MITTVGLINISINSYNYLLGIVAKRTFKGYSLSNTLQLYHTILLTTVTMLYERSLTSYST